MRNIGLARRVVAAFAAVAAVAVAGDFEKPVRIEADGKVITTDVGHSAPYVYDFDGDGKRDLLVGQFGEGKLRIYRNVGTNAKPVYKGMAWFMAGGQIAKVPAS